MRETKGGENMPKNAINSLLEVLGIKSPSVARKTTKRKTAAKKSVKAKAKKVAAKPKKKAKSKRR